MMRFKRMREACWKDSDKLGSVFIDGSWMNVCSVSASHQDPRPCHGSSLPVRTKGLGRWPPGSVPLRSR